MSKLYLVMDQNELNFIQALTLILIITSSLLTAKAVNLKFLMVKVSLSGALEVVKNWVTEWRAYLLTARDGL